MEPIGNLRDDEMTLEDILRAAEQCHSLTVPAPASVSTDTIAEAHDLTWQANMEQGRVMGDHGYFAWVFSLGVMAERNRVERT